MAGRPVSKKADVKKIQALYHRANNVLDVRPIIALTMRSCGCTYTEIGQVFGVSKQMVQTIIQKAESEL
jgi:DNA-directed RNA polymerase specialized sigma24 family protein